MEIAKGISSEFYKSLDLSDYNSLNWNKVINIVYQRLTERFIEPADKLIEFEQDLPLSQRKYGFAILALDCLLTETIQAFYDGIGDSTGKSKYLFISFFEK